MATESRMRAARAILIQHSSLPPSDVEDGAYDKSNIMRCTLAALARPIEAGAEDQPALLGEIASTVRFTKDEGCRGLTAHFSFPKEMTPDQAIEIVTQMVGAMQLELGGLAGCPLHEHWKDVIDRSVAPIPVSAICCSDEIEDQPETP